jgi:Flp pilus assembly CpaF family ATPase
MLNESHRRLFEKLHHDLGKEIISALQNKAVNEIMLNPDGGLWVDHSDAGLCQVGSLTTAQGYSIMHAVAGIHNVVVSFDHPRLESELPHFGEMRGERFTGQVPPIVSAPCFTVRKKSERVFTLDDYVGVGRLQKAQAAVLSQLVQARKNILVCGGPGSGKTTVVNALIAEAVQQDKNQRFLLLEPQFGVFVINLMADNLRGSIA